MFSIFGDLSPKVTAETTPCPKLPPPEVANTADLCLGWFWTPDFEFSKIKGVVDTVVGYAGGKTDFPTYKSIQDHTEAIRVVFDPKVLSYEQVLDMYFQMGGVPTYPGYSRQYRHAILYHTAEQREAAERVITRYEQEQGTKKIFVDIEPATDFYRAEEYHQKYVRKSLG